MKQLEHPSPVKHKKWYSGIGKQRDFNNKKQHLPYLFCGRPNTTERKTKLG